MTVFRKLNYRVVAEYLVIAVGFLLFGKLEKNLPVYSVAVLTVALLYGYSPFLTPLIYLGSFFVLGEKGMLLPAVPPAIFLPAVFLIYKKFRTSPSYAAVIYTLLSLSLFVITGNDGAPAELERRLIAVAVSGALTLFLSVAVKSVAKKGLKYKLGYEEFASLFIVIVAAGIGTCNLISPLLWKFIAVFSILTVCFIFGLGAATLFSAILGFPIAVYYGNITYVSVFLLYGVVAESLMPLKRHLSSVAVVLCDFAVQYFFNVYGSNDFILVAPVAAGALLFSCIPQKPFDRVKENLMVFREKQLVRQTINRNRIMLSNRLYDLSCVFSDMAEAFELFKRKATGEETAKSLIIKEIRATVCADCDNNGKCHSRTFGKSELMKLLDVGFAKGKVSLIDLPENLVAKCGRPNNLLYGLNKLIADYRSYALDYANLNAGREMISKEAEGVSEILRGLAFESGTLLKYRNDLERTLFNELLKNGFLVEETLVYGENENLTVSVVILMKEFNLTAFSLVLCGVLGRNMSLIDKNDISEDKCCLTFGVSARLDAVFGVSVAVKDGSIKSGDTHSVIRLKDDRFLIALSDGMGSGEDAERLSSISLSLIESFYKAGLKSEVILGTVNRLLSFNEEDDFTALDVSVIDLKKGTADYIKYGSPYGFILAKEGIKIVEGNSLPLGILNELKPSVSTTPVKSGDVVLLVTDGVSDAFKDSTAIIDFLRTLPAKNPQTLTDCVLKKAIDLSDGKKKDDMTVLAARIFKS